MRYFYRGASELSLDNIERVLIPKVLLQYAEIDKDVVLFAYGEQIELWNAKAYEKLLENEPDNFDEILEGLHKEVTKLGTPEGYTGYDDDAQDTC